MRNVISRPSVRLVARRLPDATPTGRMVNRALNRRIGAAGRTHALQPFRARRVTLCSPAILRPVLSGIIIPAGLTCIHATILTIH